MKNKKNYFGFKPKSVTCPTCHHTYLKTSITKECSNPKCPAFLGRRQRAYKLLRDAREMGRKGIPPTGLTGHVLQAYRQAYGARMLA